MFRKMNAVEEMFTMVNIFAKWYNMYRAKARHLRTELRAKREFHAMCSIVPSERM
jgi:hypothetical protein